MLQLLGMVVGPYLLAEVKIVLNLVGRTKFLRKRLWFAVNLHCKPKIAVFSDCGLCETMMIVFE